MSIYAELSYQNQKVEIQEVKGIQFSVLSPDEIVRRSVGNITRNDISTENAENMSNSLSSTKMGAGNSGNSICATCGLKSAHCCNHFGHIALAKPLYSCLYFEITRKILKCVCYRCSRILISPHTQHEDLKNDMSKIMSIKNNQKRFEAYFKLCNTTTKIKLCGDDKHIGCGSRQPDRYNKEAAMKIIAEWKDKSKETSSQLEFSAEDVLRIFKRITDEDMEVMGFNPTWNRPEWMILTVLPVPPPAVRPSIIEENGQRREDDLTHKLSDIIKTNNNILDKINKGASEETIKLITMVLQYHVFTLMDNQIPGLAPSQQRNGRKLKSICDRMRKKDGRIRGNLNGKRVDQSARSVITPDPYISIDELGVPIKVALNITFQEVVNEYNIEEMKRLILNGPDVWPGAKYIRKGNDMITINLKYADLNKIANEIRYGDIVHRHLNNGDYVLFNRQPSLHKMSMMCHKVIVMPYQTFRLNVLDTPPYNADFDGDEMNLHCPQNIQTMCELKDLAAVPYLILTQKDGKPSIEIVQDTLVGSFRLTKDYTIVGDKQMANLQMCNSYFKGKLDKPSKDYTYTGREVFSEILPPALFIEEKNRAGNDVIIKNSKLIAGNLDKAVFHNITKGLIPVIYHDYGPVEIKKFLDNTQRLVCRWLLTAGFSIGISDLVTDKNTEGELIAKIKEMKANAYKKLEDMRKGNLENNSIFNNEDFLERELIGVLNETTSMVANISLAKIDEKTNRMFNMVKSGSKGKETNIAQIMACVGQQNVDGKRISYGFTDRTLPHFTKYDDGPEARGFVENSFIAGLAPHEVFFHAMGGREGLIDTAVKSVSGDTEILVIEDGISKCVKIGDWIDKKLDDENNKDKIEYSGEEELNMELLNVNNDILIATGDDKGNVKWANITAITRHDPNEILYKIRTRGGREVIVPNSQSLLIWNGEGFYKKKTDLVVVGDFVPTIAKLERPPTIIRYIDMSKYFPKNEYIYGSDLLKAKELYLEEKNNCIMRGDNKFTRGWFNINNGNKFTVPYDNIVKFYRGVISGRSNIDNIKENRIYPYSASRQNGFIPSQFELNRENGRFIGLYLADGNSHCNCVSITKKEPSVLEFVKMWFNKHNINYKISNKKVEANSNGDVVGETITINGYNALLVKFLNNLVGTNCYNKRIPEIAYNSPEEFIIGLLDGYFSGDGTIDKKTGAISASSASKELITGINTLCNYLGIFCKLSTSVLKKTNLKTDVNKLAVINRISIRAQWAKVFYNKISLINDSKNIKLRLNEEKYKKHPYFNEINDVVFDTITEITELNEDEKRKYNKLYDLTIPDTFNFALRNGLVVNDTSSTGYAQRKLVKAMEDAKINYDNSVRNANGTIIQFIYGEDGMDGCKIENQFLPTIEMSYLKMEEEFNITPVDKIENYLVENVRKEVNLDTYKRCKTHFLRLLDDKMFMIVKVNNYNKNSKIKYPIPFNRIISTAIKRRDTLGIVGTLTDLTPDYILDKIDMIIKELFIKDIEDGNYKDDLFIEDEDYLKDFNDGKRSFTKQSMMFFHILLRCYLSPKKMIIKHNFSKELFDWTVNQIYEYFYEALAPPSEMVGVVAAQTIGEMGTQMTLDSFHVSGTAAAVKATSGVPRLNEILSATKKTKTPTLIIYMKPDVASVVNPIVDADGINYNDDRVNIETKDRAMKIKNSLEITRLADILESSEIYWDSGNGTSIEADRKILEIYDKFRPLYDAINKNHSRSNWVLRMKFNKEKIVANGLRMIDIYTRLNKIYNKYIDCVYSDDNAEECVFRIRLTEYACKDIENKDEIAAIKAMEHNIVYQVLLKGYKGINKVSLNKKKYEKFNVERGEFDKIVEWVLDTDGTNLMEILANPNIDASRTISNDIREIYNVLGVEAARTALAVELTNVIGEGAMNYRHLSLLIDTMTYRGGLMSIDRHGINRNSSSALSKSSFEESVDMLINASIFSEYDNTSGISPQVMLGKVANCGTGNFDIVLDEEYMMELMRTSKIVKKDKNRKEKYEVVDRLEDDDIDECDIENIGIDFKMKKNKEECYKINKQEIKII
jgi:DNA-directed RNA polymerase beta' subunit